MRTSRFVSNIVVCVAALFMLSVAVTSQAGKSHNGGSSQPGQVVVVTDPVAGLTFDVPTKVALDAKVCGTVDGLQIKAKLQACIKGDFTLVFGPTDGGTFD